MEQKDFGSIQVTQTAIRWKNGTLAMRNVAGIMMDKSDVTIWRLLGGICTAFGLVLTGGGATAEGNLLLVGVTFGIIFVVAGISFLMYQPPMKTYILANSGHVPCFSLKRNEAIALREEIEQMLRLN